MQIHKEQLAEVVPLWYDLALKFHKDDATAKAFGWIQEASPRMATCDARRASDH